MQFTPKSEEELQREELCPVGTHPFTVMQSSEVESKSVKNAGKIMLKLKLDVHGPDGSYHIYDYVADWFRGYKLRHFAFTVGLGADYNNGCLDGRDNAFAGRTGYCEIQHQEGKDGFPPKAVVDDYVVKQAEKPEPVDVPAAKPKLAAKPIVTPKAVKAEDAGAGDDDVPF